MVERLSESCHRHGRSITEASSAIRGYDVLQHNIAQVRSVASETLEKDGWSGEDIARVTGDWFHAADYLLTEHNGPPVDLVVGNPPYIRLEDVPDARMQAYRRTCSTMTGRSDIYIGFFETALSTLRPTGRLGFICADRWMRNQYGRHLRRLIADAYNFEFVMSMHDVDTFETQVAAYPAITIIRRSAQGATVIADTTSRFTATDAREVLEYTHSKCTSVVSNDRYEVGHLPHWFNGDESWPAGNPKRLAMIECLSDKFPALEDEATGTRVGIGVATGADEVFVAKVAEVEEDRLLPLAMVQDLATGRLDWSKHYLVNPWTTDGKLVDLPAYPLLQQYYESHRRHLAKRHIASKAPANWYRTIDKIDPRLTAKWKLLIPDMRTTMHPVLDEGGTYPHHNLYYVVSDTWDLRVLGGLLLSRVAQAFVEAYSVRMRGGTLRFQAQYLRRIRVPRFNDLTTRNKQELADAFALRDVDMATRVALQLYGLKELY
jgi:hypothetical protein